MAFRSHVKVLLVAAFDAPFIRDDVRALGKHFSLRTQIGHGFRAVFRIVRGVLNTDIVFCWFASVYAFVGVAAARLFGVKSLVVVGGVDAAKDEELQYGIWLNPRKARLVRYVFRNADRILVVDPCLRDESIRLAEYDGKNITYLPTGYDSAFWRPMGEKERLVLMVALVRDERTLRRKGIDTLVEVARRLPSITFIVVGIVPVIAEQLHAPLNVKLIPPIPREDVLLYYQRAKVYCQPSRREGMPNALCEAMLCECIPIASDVSGNPTAVGDTGILIPAGNADALASALLKAMEMDERAGARARARIVSLFPTERRESELVRLIEGFVQ